MIKSILINDNKANEINMKTNNISEENLYKKFYLKNNNNFIKIETWNYDNKKIELWGKNKGINKFNNNNDNNDNDNNLNNNKKSNLLEESDDDEFLNDNNSIKSLDSELSYDIYNYSSDNSEL